MFRAAARCAGSMALLRLLEFSSGSRFQSLPLGATVSRIPATQSSSNQIREELETLPILSAFETKGRIRDEPDSRTDSPRT